MNTIGEQVVAQLSHIFMTEEKYTKNIESKMAHIIALFKNFKVSNPKKFALTA